MVEVVGGIVHSRFICEGYGCAQVDVHNINETIPEPLGRLSDEMNPAQAVV